VFKQTATHYKLDNRWTNQQDRVIQPALIFSPTVPTFQHKKLKT